MMTATQIIKAFNEEKGTRLNWESLWDELAKYCAPLKEYYASAPGEKKYTHLLDTTAMTSAELLAGALHGMLTNPAGYFFNLTTGDQKLDDDDEVRLWIQEVVRVLHNIANNSNFQTEVHEYYLTLVSLGTGVMLIEEDDEHIVRFSTRAMKEVYICENSHGMVDKLYRCYELDAEGLVNDFGYKNLPKKVQEAYNKNTKQMWEVIHVIYPKKENLTKAQEAKYKLPFISQYVLKSEKEIIKTSGFNEFPYIASRWTKLPGEKYGRGPGEKALAPSKALQVMRETTIKGAQKVVDPPLQAPDDGFLLQINTQPAGISFYRAGSNDRIEPIFNDSRIDFGYQSIDQERLQVREAFYTDQLKLREGPQMTATEVAERVEQALRFLGPMLGRQNFEFLTPLVSRLYAIADRKDLIPPIPQKIENRKLQIRYSSVMAMQQRMSELQNITRGLQAIAPFITLDQSVAHVFNGDAAATYIAKLTNFPQELIRSKKEIDAIRQQLSDQQKAMAEAEAENVKADSTNKLAQASKNMQPPKAG